MHPRRTLARRDFLKLSAVAAGTQFLPVEIGQGLCGEATGAASPLRAALAPADAFNYVVGTQAIGATYQFTSQSVLVETAQAILDMGSNLLKFTMGRGYSRMMLKPSKTAYPETMQYLLNQGIDAKGKPRRNFPGAAPADPPEDPGITTLTELARREPSYRRVFDMPLSYYLIWTYTFTADWWNRGFPEESRKKEYDEIYALAAYLLKTYHGSGKTFLLGHWEGDWHLRPDLNVSTDRNVTPESLQGMTDWLNARQKAVDDAKRDTPHANVAVYHYCEVNHVTAVSLAGRPSVTNRVLPRTNVDYVSYSTYDSLGDITRGLPKALDYIEAKLAPKPSIPGKRVFVGEYGFPARSIPEPERDRRSRAVIRAGLAWGCPFVLCWQMYNNEYKDGHENGYWLIDDKGVKQPLWHTHHDLYVAARRYVADHHRTRGRLPTAEEYRQFALAWLG